MKRRPGHVLVVGSLNIDYVATVDRLPRPGETLAAHNLTRWFGGKGANQAVAAARQGARVSFLGCVGADDLGRAYLRRLRQERVDVRGIASTPKALTGTALIAVERSGENLIIVDAGANGRLTPQMVRAQASRLASVDIALLQFEIPMPALLEAVRLLNRARVPVALNPSPMREGFPWGKCALDTLLVNRGEAEIIFGFAPEHPAAQLPAWRRAMARKKIGRLLITQGAAPTLCITDSQCLEVPALRVKPVDTVGAGDTFAGAFVTRRAEGADLFSAVRAANCAAALATLKPGAQEAIPSRGATDAALRRLPGVVAKPSRSAPDAATS